MLGFAGTASVGVIYDFVSRNGNEVIGTLEFAATSNASPTSGWSDSGSFTFLGDWVVPEPATLSLLVLGGLAILRRRSPGRRRLFRRKCLG